MKQLEWYVRLARNSFWIYTFKGVAFVCDRPKTLWDNEYRLHSEHYPSVEFRDGWGFYYWHGIQVPEKAITNISSYSAVEIINEPNTEVRRALMSMYGWERILGEVKSKVIDQHPNPLVGRLHEFTIGEQKYHCVECADPGNVFAGNSVYNTFIGTPTSINKVVPALKSTYPLAREMTDGQFLEVQLNRA